MKLYSVISVFVVISLVACDGARILGIFPPAAPSHYSLGNKLMIELAKKGHDVTYISSFARKEPVKGIKDVVLTGFGEEMEAMKKEMLSVDRGSIISQFSNFMKTFSKQAEDVLKHPNVQPLFAKNVKFDLVVMETFMNEAHMGFGYHFKAPTVVVSTVGATLWVNEYVRNYFNPAVVPEIMGSLPSKMGYFDRVKNTLLSNALSLAMHIFHIPTQDGILHKYFPDAPPLLDLMHNNISIALLNSHPSYGISKPGVPNMVEIGGFHVDEPKALPEDLQKYLDSAKEGFILFSMGSNLRSNMLPLELRNKLMKTFAKLPYQILWKFEDDKMEGKPANVKIHKWLPQNDILAHPNLKLFITHGGLLSTTEAVYHGVPIVGIPVVGDQKSNMANSERLGLGKTVEFQDLNADKLFEAVTEVLKNESYRNNIRQRSILLRDQPLRPIDNAIFWIEYSIRNGYANHFKTAAIDLKWYEIMLLDVYATLALGVLVAIAIPYLLIKKLCCGKKQKPKLSQQKKKN